LVASKSVNCNVPLVPTVLVKIGSQLDGLTDQHPGLRQLGAGRAAGGLGLPQAGLRGAPGGVRVPARGEGTPGEQDQEQGPAHGQSPSLPRTARGKSARSSWFLKMGVCDPPVSSFTRSVM